MSGAVPASWSRGPGAALVGREREQAMLHDALAAALGRRGSLVLVEGEAGIGKTALAEWLLSEAERQGATALVGRCYDLAETPPYGPWRELFAAAPRDDALPVLPDALLAAEGGGEAVASQEAIVARVRAYLAALAGRGPVLLLLDDLHWADPASLDLLRAVARGLGDLALLLVVAYRAEEVGRGHPLYALLPILVREARAARLDLPPLTARDLGVLVGLRYPLSGWESVRLVAHLHERSQGNPFFAGELIRTLAETGAIARVPGTRPTAGHPLGIGAPADGDALAGGGWRLGALDEARLPALLRQVIDARVARLGEEAAGLLAVAAVLGHDIPLALWQEVAGATAAALDEVTERALAAHILVELPDGAGVRFAHTLTREALYEGLPLPRRRRWHRLVAEVLLARADPDPDAVANHLQRAGDERAIGWLLRSSERALRAYAYVTAAARRDAALHLLERQGGAAATRGWLHLGQGLLLHYSNPESAAQHADRALQLATAAGDPELTACAFVVSGHFRCTLWDFRRGIADLRAGVEALDRLPAGEAAWAAMLRQIGHPLVFTPRGLLSANLAFIGACDEARTVAASDLAAPPASGVAPDAIWAVDAHVGLGIAYVGLGDPGAARQAFAAARATIRTTTQHLLIGYVDFLDLAFAVLPFQTEQQAERAALAMASTAAWLPTSETMPDARFPLLGRAPLLLLEGRWAELDALVREGPPANPIDGTLWPGFWQLRYARGDTEGTRALIREVLPEGLQTVPGTAMLHTTLNAQRLAAALALDAGDLGGARDWLEAHDRWLAWSGTVPGRAEGALGWGAYYRAAGRADVAREFAGRALALAHDPRQPPALLAAHRLLGELDTAGGRHAAAQAHLDAALALADACAAPYERALTLLALAALHGATGAPDAARADLDAARATLDPLGAAPALALAAALAADFAPASAADPPPAGLSAREVEVLRLVAEGLTDAEVARQLALSRRTIGTHLTSIYTKLAVPSRTAAARAARDLGLC